MTAIATIHVAKKQLGLDDDTYRALLLRLTGKDSTKAMSEFERIRVVEELRIRGFKPASTGTRKSLEGRFAKKLQALWIAAWNLGVVRNRDDAALVAFVKRQTGIDHVRFLRHPEDAAKAIEALKRWIAREAGVDWAVDRPMTDWSQSNSYRIACAQLNYLAQNEPTFAQCSTPGHWLASEGMPPVAAMDDGDWQLAMNRLGELVRKARKANCQ